MGHRICIVSAYRPDLLEEVQHALSFGQNIEVFVDRRVGDRRAGERDASGSDRRKRSIEAELRAEGYAIIEQG
jgi:hypothetical protein